MNSKLYWFTGLSGAGKTTIGSLFFKHLKEAGKNVVFLDGDILRAIFLDNQKYALSDRKKLAMRYSNLCKMLVDQDINVVIATISMFDEVREWNRKNIKNYKEVYIKVPIDILIKRDKKNIYSGALKGKIKNVMGIDIEFEEPRTPDITIVNDGSVDAESIVEIILDKFRLNK
tara:strand:- start:6 stop:524 length:519 start_codon:yes stop_codon:yes gene_type:complete